MKTIGQGTTINGVYWILQKREATRIKGVTTGGRLLLDTLSRTRSAAYTAGANSLDTTIADLKKWGWRAVKVVLDYK